MTSFNAKVSGETIFPDADAIYPNCTSATVLPPRSDADRAAPLRSSRAAHRAKYSRYLAFSDAIIVCCSVTAGQIIKFANGSPDMSLTTTRPASISYPLVSLLLAIIWIGLLSLGSRSPRYTERGIEEYVVLTVATVQLFGVVAIASVLLQLDMSRGYLGITLPLGLAGLIASRWVWRRIAARQRRSGLHRTPLLVVGGARAAHDIAMEFGKDPWAGYEVIGICTPGGPRHPGECITVGGTDVPIVGEDEAIIDAVQRTGVQTVALAATDHLRPVEIRRLIWDLDALGVDLLVAPGLVDIAQQRMLSRPVAGLAIFEIAKPQYSRANSMTKRAFDIIFASTALIMLAPVMLVAAIAVERSGPGGVFYRSERIGLGGKPFKMTKFRSMHSGADAAIAGMIESSGADTLFFKVKNDPRVTRAGAVLRKYSIDELPQFLDVLRGDMSVVGPRPQVRREVDTYDDLVRRRLVVKPGLTGLWQVSGRSDLEVEDAVRLDLSYVENWSLMGDIAIIARTVRTVLRGDGAY